MSILDNFINTLVHLIPTGIAVLIVVLVIAAVRYLINKRASKSNQNVTRQVVTMLLSFLGLLVVILILPDRYLNETSHGQLLSLIGILLSASIALSSTTFVGNAMAGMMLRSVRSFKPGDFVRVGDHFGRVTERGLFHVEIQNEDRDLTTLPNLYLVTNPVKVILSSGTVISSEVSLGYDILHDEVESVLKTAAQEAGLSDPFVLIMELGDFSVTYRVSGMLEEVKHLISIRSKLRAKMLDGLHRAGIEIVSPNFMNTRALSPNKNFVPESYTKKKGADVSNDPGIERLVFDIADEAESIEKLHELHAKTVQEIGATRDQMKEAVSPEAKEGMQQRIDRYEARLVQIDALIEKTKESKPE
ncbi:MAG: mechanosensitive ion channel [Acidobacteriota bacterium]